MLQQSVEATQERGLTNTLELSKTVTEPPAEQRAGLVSLLKAKALGMNSTMSDDGMRDLQAVDNAGAIRDSRMTKNELSKIFAALPVERRASILKALEARQQASRSSEFEDGMAEMKEFQGDKAGATGDPHMTNILGQRFDLIHPGQHALLQIPKGARTQLFHQHINAQECLSGARTLW